MNSLIDNLDAFDSIRYSEDNFLQDNEFNRPASIMAICTDATRHGSAIYVESSLQLVADKKDPGDQYNGLDIVIQRMDPSVVIVSSVQRKLIAFLERKFNFEVLDLSRRRPGCGSRPSQALSNVVSQTNLSAIETTFSQAKRPRVEPTPSTSTMTPVESISEFTTPQDPSEFSTRNESIRSAELGMAFTLVIVPNIWFSISRGIKKLIDSELVRSKGLVEPEEKSFYVTSRIDRSADVCAIRAISALENYLTHLILSGPGDAANATQSGYLTQQSKDALLPQDSTDVMPILELRYVDPGPILSINKSTFKSLNIFSEKQRNVLENNPNIDAANEAIPSLYDLLNLCNSPQGKKQMRSIMLLPLQDYVELKHRLDAVDYLKQPENGLFREQIATQLKNVVPLTNLLTRFSHSVCTYKELATVYKSLWAFVAIIDLIKANVGHGLEILYRITKLDCPELRKSVDSIVNVVDFESSKKEKRVQVFDGIDQEVDEKKEVVKNLAKFCDEVANQETSLYKDVLGKACRVFYIPRIGFLNSCDYSTIPELQRISSHKEFDVLLSSENSIYFKTKRMEELDNNAGDIACDLIDVQEGVVMNLQTEIFNQSETILKLVELCGELDCLISFALVSFQRNYTRPEFVTSDEELDIRDVYHPLYCVRYNMVPNNVRFYKDSSERKVKIMIITGPNSCGKSTYMKATCLAIYMAHIGCFVPATSAKIPLFDAILTRMHSANSISTGLSSFATDLHQINFALSTATARSILAIDEFGKGTQARDGFHLLKGLVSYFASRGQASPYVMIVTHFNRLIDHLQNYSEYILYKTFKVAKDKDKIVYEYEIKDGISEASFADKVAARAGVSLEIIERANHIRDYITEGRAIRPRPPTAA